MLDTQARKSTTPKVMYLPVEGITVHQPLPKILEKVEEWKREGRGIIALLRALDEADTETRKDLQSQLTNAHRELGRWGIPLFVHMPYSYPPDFFTLSD
jgi:hypothetical protein